MFDLTDKKVLITGATGGIGEELVNAFYSMNAQIMMTGTREEKLKELQAKFPKAQYIVSDISNSESLTNLYSKTEEILGGIDVLICNAGITRDALALRMKEEDWDDVINVNLKSVFLLNKLAIKSMSKNRYGRIINISSVVAFTGNFGQANYVAAKSGVVGLTKTLALESASRGVTVNCVAPGFISSPMTEKLSDGIKEAIIAKIPLGRIGEPKEISSACVFLASDAASYVTGTTIHVNGGMFM